MKVVNLSRRPFVNRRPANRLGTILWIVGGLLLLVNAWLYATHFSGSSKGQELLGALGRQVDEEQKQLNKLADELQDLDLRARNRKAKYLNSLIHTRTFPWSALFDDLESVLPIDVYLGSVRPSLRLAKQPSAAAAGSGRALTAREARARARGESTRAVQAIEEEEDFYSGDRVTLTVRAFARTDEAMFDFVDRLYQNPSFENPTLSRESTDRSGKVSFNIKVVYLTPKDPTVPPEEGSFGADAAIAEERAAGAGAPEGTVVAQIEGEPGVATPGVATPGVATPGRAPGFGTPGASSGAPLNRASVGEGGEPPSSSRATRGAPGSRNRNVRRAEPQQLAELPPEEGEAASRRDNSRRNRSTGSSSRDRIASRDQGRGSSGPSTVSVAPGFVIGNPAAGAQPSEQAEAGGQPSTTPTTRPSGNQTTRPTGQTTRPSQTTQPSGTTRPTGQTTRPSTPNTGNPGTNPTPTNPSASSSPRLQGSFFDRWIPDFLKWTPDYSDHIELSEEVLG